VIASRTRPSGLVRLNLDSPAVRTPPTRCSRRRHLMTGWSTIVAQQVRSRESSPVSSASAAGAAVMLGIGGVAAEALGDVASASFRSTASMP
jgi:hypothetical protein